ncbi:hypothetical protein RhiirA5_386010 [Rhizophagus irregularis]|uniref:Uncharacterized protein n=1 Tax=Rhizophagus irregularis TaxID=588596 RepID=A0A2N0NLJ1_9GLOM|nr:hypothetical protein RhiirA5_386010 [Rhizophagus irregularis]
MGNNNKKKTLIKKQSSYISTQEFVDKFTAAFTDILRYTLIAVEHHSKEEYTAKVIIKPLVLGGDLVKPTSLADTYSVGPLTSEVFYGIISEAHLKARQQLDSLSSRTSFTTTPIGTAPPNVIIQSEEKNNNNKRYWKLKDRKERKRFQAKLHIPADAHAQEFKIITKGKALKIYG